MNSQSLATTFSLTLSILSANLVLLPPANAGSFSSVGTLNEPRQFHTATLLANGKVLVAGGATGTSYDANADLFDPAAGNWTAIAPMVYPRDYCSATLLQNGKVLVSGGSSLSAAELYDPANGSWTLTGSMSTLRSYHTATLLNNGKVLVAGGYHNATLTSAEIYDPATGTWTPTGSMNVARYMPSATLLANGKVLVIGGYDNSAEVYDPGTGTWTPTGSLIASRGYPASSPAMTATLLANGKVLVAGGLYFSSLATAELYDPVSGTWTATGPMTAARSYHTANRLADGRVLVSGGYNVCGYLGSAELYDPNTGTWTPTGWMAAARQHHQGTTLPDGKLLVSGGANGSGALASAEVYDPAGTAGTGSLTVTLNPAGAVSAGARWQVDCEGTFQASGAVVGNLAVGTHAISFKSIVGWVAPPVQMVVVTANVTNTVSATYIQDGALRMTIDPPAAAIAGAQFAVDFEVYVGPFHNSGTVVTNLAPGNHTVGFSSIPGWVTPANHVVPVSSNATNNAVATYVQRDATTDSMTNGRVHHTATLLLNGKVLVAGGSTATGYLSTAELYDPTAGKWTALASMNNPHAFHTATLLANGKVLVASGLDNSAELYDPATGVWTVTGALQTARASHTATLLANGKVLVAGGNRDSNPFSTAVSSAELYDPATGIWTTTGSMSTARVIHTATLLPNGKVVVVGGFPTFQTGLTSAELYDPAAGTWASTGALTGGRAGHAAILLPTGKVLVEGGTSSAGFDFLPSAELYDPATGAWTATGSLSVGRYFQTVTLLTNGQALVIGGVYSFSATAGAELFDPTTGIWTEADALNTARYSHTATLLPDGTVLVAGGLSGGYTYSPADGLATAELYAPGRPGSLTVTLGPAGAVSGGAQWQVDGGAFQNSGAVVTNLSVGNHTVSFKDIAAFSTPGNQIVAISANVTNTASATYTTNLGALQVTLSPAGAISAGAQWRVDAGPFQNSGAVVANLSIGNHTVSFSTVAGWATPADQTVAVSANLTNTASGAYAINVGGLQVTINPAGAVSAGAQWQVDGGPFQNSGAVVANLAVGNHTVLFSTVSGWITPGSQTVTVNANATNTASGTYTLNSGAVQVTITPAGAVGAGAQWQVDGGAFQNSGAVVANLSAGNHTVGFSTVVGWVTPANQIVAVSANATNTASGNYTAVTFGALQVTITPAAAVSAGAQWQVDGGPMQNSGNVAANLPAGNHTVSFSTLSGWVSPSNQIVAVTANTTNTASGAYTLNVGSVQVTINPPAAVSAGAQWLVDGGPLQNSAAVVTNLPVGNHTVSFSPLAGWVTPGNQTVTVSLNATNITSGAYLLNVGALQVTIDPPAAVTAGAQWQVDSGALQNSGAVVTNLPVGNHTVAFSSVTGWITPGNQTVGVSFNATNTSSGTYKTNSGAVRTWNGSTSTDWLNPLNWTPFGVPDPTDTVILNNGGTITFSAPVTHNGAFNWSVGRLSGSSNALTLGPSAVMSLLPGNYKYLSGTVSNAGTILLNGVTLYVENNPPARLVNLPGGEINSTGADSLNCFGACGGVIENQGLFLKSAGGDSIISTGLVFTNSATVEVDTNALEVGNGWHVGGSYVGAGVVRLVNSNSFRGSINSANLLLQSGYLDASGALLHGNLTWFTGTLNTGTNTPFNIAGDGALTLVPGNYKFLAGTLGNSGLMRLTGGTALYFYTAPTCQLINLSGGVLESGGADLFESDGQANRLLENRGLFRKTGGADTIVSANVLFTNTATVDIQTNALEVRTGWHVGGNYPGVGVLRLVNVNNLRGGLSVSNLNFASGSLDASGALLHGNMTWITGTLSTGTNTPFNLASDGTLTLVPGNYKYLAGTLANAGLMRLTGGTALYLYTAPVCQLINLSGGVLESAGADVFDGDGQANRILENRGLFRKSAGADTVVTFNVVLTNTSTVDIQTNALEVHNGWHVGGSYSGAGTLRLPNVNNLRGSINVSNLSFPFGTLDASGAQLHGRMTWITGTLITGTNAPFNLASDAALTLVPGNFKYLSGVLTNSGLIQLTNDAGVYFYTASAVRLVNSPGGVLLSSGNDLFDGDGLPNRVIENNGIFRKTGGLGNTTVTANVRLAGTGILDMQTGVLQVNSAYTNSATEMRFRLNGVTNYGRLAVSGPVTLGGNLALSVQPPFIPASNNVFHVLTTSARTGAFATVTGTDLGNGLALLVTNLSTGVDLLVTGAAIRPVLSPPILTGGEIWFQFPSTTGALYTIEFNDDLQTSNWLPRVAFPGDGKLQTFTEPATNRPARFFRVHRQ